MILAMKIDTPRYDVHDIWIPANPSEMKLAVLRHLAATRLAIGAVMPSGDILLIDPDKPQTTPNFLFSGAGAPIPGLGIIVGPVCKTIAAPVSLSVSDVLDRTVFMSWLDAREWIGMWSNEIEVSVSHRAA